MTFSQIVAAEEAALNIEVKVWERARQVIDCLITSQRAANQLKENLRLAVEASPTVLADVEEAKRRLERRRQTHAQLIGVFGNVCREIGDAVDGITTTETT